MTIDKIKYYLKEPLFSYISGLNTEQLKKQKTELINDIKTVKHSQNVIFTRNIELKYINYLLGEI